MLPEICDSTYKYNHQLQKREQRDEYGSALAGQLEVKPIRFQDTDGNQELQAGERGYFLVELQNNSQQNVTNISGRLGADARSGMLQHWDELQLGTLRAGQRKRVAIPVSTAQNLPKGEYALDLSLELYGNHINQTKLQMASNQAAPARLSVTGQFTPARNPQPGEQITLQIELHNIGGTTSQPMEAGFILPRGVRSISNQKVRIPALQPHQPKTLQFSFSYTEAFADASIDVNFETSGRGLMSVLQSFSLPVSNARGSTMTAGVPDEMFWISHDSDENGSRSFSVASSEIDLKVKVLSGQQLQKKNFSVMVNGVRLQGQKMDEEELSPPTRDMGRFRQSYSNKVLLKRGANKVRIVYDYGNGKTFTSPELTFDYTNAKRPKLHVLSIGVPYDNLKYTTKDALDIAQLYDRLKLEPNGFKEIDVNPLTTPLETSTNTIKEVFERLSHRSSRIKKEDLLVIYISAHGKVNRFGEFLLMPSDYKPDAEKTYSINFEADILKSLQYVDCKKLVFLDACHSGSAYNGQKEWTSADAASSVMNDLIQSAPGIEIIASCGENELSYEDEKWGNSAFAEAIIEAFHNKSVQVNGELINADVFSEDTGGRVSGGDGKISLRELKQFIQKRVPYLVKSTKRNPPTQQNPSNKSTNLLPGNMGIYYLVDKK
ncbi:MAG: caspase family protein [Bacteroidota bacterium]